MRKLTFKTLLAVLLLTGASVRAEMGDGDYTAEFAGDVNLYDLSGNYSESLDGMSMDFTLNMDASGKFTGTGGASVGSYLAYMYMDLAFNGSVSASRNVTRVKMSMKLKGTGTVEGYDVVFSGSATENLEIDAQSRLMVGEVKGKVTVSIPALHKKKSAPLRESVNTPLPDDATGAWDLVLNLSTNKTKYAGTARAVMSNDRVVPFSVKGSYTPKTDTSKLTLKGVDAGRGASLSVAAALVGEQLKVRTLSGKVLGQSIKYSTGQ